MAVRAEVAAEAVDKGLGTLRLQEKMNCVRQHEALGAKPAPLAACTPKPPEERRKTLEEKTTNPETRIRVPTEKEFPKSFICVEF